jgi:ligand-binding SRPBCC domain-containing protein
MVQGSANFKTTLAKIATFLQGFLPASETAKGFVELATQAETDTGTDDATAVTPLKLKTSSQWATKITKLNIANTASGNDSVTINAESGIATFTRPITHNDVHNFTINNNTISATDVVETKLSYSGLGYPAILHCTCTANTITIHMANLKVGGGSDSTNANLVVSFLKVN